MPMLGYRPLAIGYQKEFAIRTVSPDLLLFPLYEPLRHLFDHGRPRKRKRDAGQNPG
jgi:hypothetical protein